jgi:dynein heavy chain
MERGLTPNKIVPKLRAAVDEYRLLHPVVAAMRNAALKERHWAKVFASIGTVLQRDETFTLQVRCSWARLTTGYFILLQKFVCLLTTGQLHCDVAAFVPLPAQAFAHAATQSPIAAAL